MSWQFALGLLVIINILAITLNKIVADKIPQKSIGLFYQYLFCATWGILYVVFSGNGSLNFLVLVGGMGFLLAFGSYFSWRALDISLSKTVLFYPLIGIIAVGLALIFLGEAILWNFQLILGVGFCFLAIWLFQSGQIKEERKVISKKWLYFTLGMIGIMGTTAFLVKLFSFTVSREAFLMNLYIGAFFGSLLILGLEKQNPIRISKEIILTILPLSLSFFGATTLLYWTYQLGGPVSLVIPLRGLAITIIPVFLGWFIFQERKGLSKLEWIGFILGLAGVILIFWK